MMLLPVSYADQTDIFNPATFTWPVHVIGVGGIGSALVLPLIKLGLSSKLHLWDPDRVEPHNIPAQLIYRPTDIGKLKVEAAADTLAGFSEGKCEIVCHSEYVGPSTPLDGVVISGVDSMAARYDIWEGVRYNVEVPLYMDGRIGGEQMQLFTLNPSNYEAVVFYETEWLFPDEEGSDLPCAARTVIHPPTVLAGHIIAQLTRFARGMTTVSYLDCHVRDSQVIAHDTTPA